MSRRRGPLPLEDRRNHSSPRRGSGRARRVRRRARGPCLGRTSKGVVLRRGHGTTSRERPAPCGLPSILSLFMFHGSASAVQISWMETILPTEGLHRTILWRVGELEQSPRSVASASPHSPRARSSDTGVPPPFWRRNWRSSSTSARNSSTLDGALPVQGLPILSMWLICSRKGRVGP